MQLLKYLSAPLRFSSITSLSPAAHKKAVIKHSLLLQVIIKEMKMFLFMMINSGGFSAKGQSYAVKLKHYCVNTLNLLLIRLIHLSTSPIFLISLSPSSRLHTTSVLPNLRRDGPSGPRVGSGHLRPGECHEV